MLKTQSTLFMIRFSGKWTLLAIALVCLMPLVLATYFRFVANPDPPSFAGKALVPSPFPYGDLQQINGQKMDRAGVGDQWLVVHVEHGACSLACRDALYLTRQARTAQGRNMMRVQRIWIISDAKVPSKDLLTANPDLLLVRPTTTRLLQQMNQESASLSEVIYLVDRRGFLVFRYDAHVAPGAFIRELGNLIRF
jgi:hypothetical protein